jgi:exopolyphosphatase/guanosine-5'-triphosphate,3'-diphosphate pyrophosphatase
LQNLGKSALSHWGERRSRLFSSFVNNVFAGIDVGSQAVRLKIARHARGGGLERIFRRRIPLRSGDHVFGAGHLGDDVIEPMVQALRVCSDDSARHRARLRAVATSSLREAANRAEVLAYIRARTGVELDVISGREEARLVCLGVLEGRAPQLRSLCIDLGGGSVEVAVAQGEYPVALHSLAQGALRLSRQIGTSAKVPLSELRSRAREAAAQLPPLLGRGTRGAAIGSSGTIRALVEYIGEGTRAQAFKHEIARSVGELAAMDARERRRWFGDHRADVIVAGAALLEALLDHLGVDVIHASKRGLRDGVLIELSRSHALPLQTATRLSPSVSA